MADQAGPERLPETRLLIKGEPQEVRVFTFRRTHVAVSIVSDMTGVGHQVLFTPDEARQLGRELYAAAQKVTREQPPPMKLWTWPSGGQQCVVRAPSAMAAVCLRMGLKPGDEFPPECVHLIEEAKELPPEGEAGVILDVTC
jgi:hypothetical protein